MKILLLDPERNVSHRISKDTNGAYGTGNNFGDSIIPSLLKKTLKYVHDWPPMFAIYSMAVLKKNGHEVIYSKNLPDNLEDIDLFIIISSIVCCETEIKKIKEILLVNKKILVIGPFATNNPKKYLDAGASVISGEPEFYFLQNKNLSNIDYNKVINFTHNFNLDDLPYPDWGSVITNQKTSILFGLSKSLPILATRGCPYSCFKYCVYPLQQGRVPRQRDPVKIVDELEHWYRKYNVKMFIFRDPVFSINRKHTISFCNELIARKINIKFIIETHLRILDTELIKLLKKAGLRAAKVGVESADEKVLKEANRYSIKKDDMYLKIRELENNKILISAMYILGYPTDSEKTILNTINYAKELNTTFAQFNVWTPYPGTPVFEEYKEKIIVKNFEDFDQYNLIYNHNNLTQQNVRYLLGKAYTIYYTRINWIFKFVRSFIFA